MKRILMLLSVVLATATAPARAVDPPLPDSFLAASAGTSVDLFETFALYQESIIPSPGIGPALAEVGAPQVGTDPFVRAKAETNYGVNKALAQISGQGPLLVASGISYWTDSFTAMGGGGVATVSSTLTGTIGPDLLATAVYVLLATNDATLFKDDDRLLGAVDDLILGIEPTDFTVVFSHVATNFDSTPIVLTGAHPYTTDPFYMASLLATLAYGEGQVDLSNSVQFGITASTPLAYGSGTLYPAAVPEPGTWAMLMAGLLLLAVAARRRVSQAG